MAEIQIERSAEEALVDFVTAQRWYGSKSREIGHASIIEPVPLREEPPLYAVPSSRSASSPAAETYQLLSAPDAPTASRGPDHLIGEESVYEGGSDPTLSRALVDLMQAGASLAGREGDDRPAARRGHATDRAWSPGGNPVSGEQSNTSIVFGDRLILKVYRRLEAGINPELELLRFLTTHHFPNVAALRGFYEYTGRPLDATLGILQEYSANQGDGWEFATDALAADPDVFVAQARRLGEVTGVMHRVLASDPDDANFAPRNRASSRSA